MGSIHSVHSESDDDAATDGSIFDDEDNIFEENEEDEEQEGSFRDERSVFSSPRDTPEDHHNPFTTRLQEEERWETGKKVNDPRAGKPVALTKPPVLSRQLVVKFDAKSRPLVARHENGRAVERFRPPTKEEHYKIQTKARLVRGGVGDVTPAATAATAGLPWKKIMIWGGGLTAVGLGGWWLWKKYRRDNDGDAEVDVVDD